MEKKEKKSDLEQLLNSLIEKGWKPFGKRDKLYAVEDGIYIFGRIASDWNTYDLRQITSKESGLWQFVCENEMRPKRVGYDEHYWSRDNHTNGRGMAMEGEPEYRLIESALCDEDKLEEFLLNSIKLD